MKPQEYIKLHYGFLCRSLGPGLISQKLIQKRIREMVSKSFIVGALTAVGLLTLSAGAIASSGNVDKAPVRADTHVSAVQAQANDGKTEAKPVQVAGCHIWACL
jgi:hypothetical protein